MDIDNQSTAITELNHAFREPGLDQTLAETFPCSDPLSSIPNPHEVA